MFGSADEAADVLRDAIEGGGDTIEVTLKLSAHTAERVLVLLEAEGVSGAVVVPVKELYSTTEAAAMLGVSRPTLMKLIDAGELEAEMVGTHHRIPAEAIVAYQRARQVRRDRAAEAMSEFTSRVGTGRRSNVTFRGRAESGR
ncbi:helix-turn-helix domain-containing protein [Cryobacterium sp. BB736]|uniref:helix-turn-helix domain-containing protein n=1 Tax=Cryobacterium sp. BB736 TaxID=2746963 RepID=UPI00351CA672